MRGRRHRHVMSSPRGVPCSCAPVFGYGCPRRSTTTAGSVDNAGKRRRASFRRKRGIRSCRNTERLCPIYSYTSVRNTIDIYGSRCHLLCVFTLCVERNTSSLKFWQLCVPSIEHLNQNKRNMCKHEVMCYHDLTSTPIKENTLLSGGMICLVA